MSRLAGKEVERWMNSKCKKRVLGMSAQVHSDLKSRDTVRSLVILSASFNVQALITETIYLEQ